MRLRHLSPLPVLVALSGCAGHDSMMSDHAELFDEHASAYQAELNDHELRIAEAPDLATIGALEQVHFQRIANHMAGMRHEMADMMSCMSSDDSWAHGAAATHDIESMGEECARHEEAMAAAEDIDVAHEEESAHQHTMAGMMEDMHSHAAMMSGTMPMACSHHEG